MHSESKKKEAKPQNRDGKMIIRTNEELGSAVYGWIFNYPGPQSFVLSPETKARGSGGPEEEEERYGLIEPCELLMHSGMHVHDFNAGWMG